MNAVSDHLEEEHEMDRRIIERVNGDYHKLLVLVFHAMYDSNGSGLGREYERMAALAKVFESNNQEVYRHDESFDITEVEGSVTDFVCEQNSGAAHGFAVENYLSANDEEVLLKLFKESSRTGKRMFDFRKDGQDEPPLEPSVGYDSTHNVKTIGMRARNTGYGSEFILSKGRGGWKNDLGGFFESVFDIPDAWNTLSKREVRGATHVVEQVKETADDEDATEEDIVERATDVFDDLSQVATEEMARDTDTPEEDIERVERLAETATLVGFKISQDEETGTAEFNIEAETKFEEWLDNIDEIEAGAKALMARAEQENLNLIYETSPEEGEAERIIVSAGTWSPAGRGMDSKTIDLVDRLLTASTEDEE